MAQKKRTVPAQVHDFLSENGKKGGQIGGNMTKRLIELGKEAALEQGEDVKAEAETESRRSRKAA